MKRILVALLVSLAIGDSSLAEDTLKIVTFNCEFLTRPKVHIKFGLPFNISSADPVDRAAWAPAAFRDEKFSEAAKAVAAVLAPIDADVIALTEVGDKIDVTELRDEIEALGVSYPHIAVGKSFDHTTKQHVAVLSKLPLAGIVESIPGRETYDEELDDPDTESNTGISKGMRVSFTVHEREIFLYVVHLASERLGHKQDAQRTAQASIVRRHYLPLLQAGDHVIVAGDLNDRRGQPALRRIRGRDDIYGDLIQTGHTQYFENDELSSRWTYQFEGVRMQIDGILLSRSLKDTCKSSKGIQTDVIDQDNPLASDHRPLVVTLRFKDLS